MQREYKNIIKQGKYKIWFENKFKYSKYLFIYKKIRNFYISNKIDFFIPFKIGKSKNIYPNGLNHNNFYA